MTEQAKKRDPKDVVLATFATYVKSGGVCDPETAKLASEYTRTKIRQGEEHTRIKKAFWEHIERNMEKLNDLKGGAPDRAPGYRGCDDLAADA